MNAAPARFTFDLDFGTPGGSSPRMDRTAAAVAGQVAEARRAGHAEGMAEGERSATSRAAKQQALAIETLADRAAGMLSLFEAAEARHRAEAVQLAASVGRKLAAHLLAQQPAAELDALLVDCLSSLHEVPHVLVRCHPQVADAVREAAEARMALSGYAGRLVVTADPSLGVSDGRIEWADGGLSRDMSAIATAIDQRIAAFVGTATEGDAT